jgi:hypothetical protein
VSLRTGFPFGRYEFTDLMGPKLFKIPLLLALAYLGMGYLSWVIALMILKYQDERLAGAKLVILRSLPVSLWLRGIFPKTRSGQTSITPGSGERRLLLRRTREQFPGLVSRRLNLLSALRAVPQEPSTRRISGRLLA